MDETTVAPLGLGVGWRPAVASLVLQRRDLGFVEILAEAHPPGRPLPLALVEARRRGLAVVPHGVGLSLGGAELPDPARLNHLALLAERVGAPLVSEHVAFVRAGGVEAGHLLPVPRRRDALEVLIENVAMAVERLPVPLALEPIASLFEWPEPEIEETEFLRELVERTGALLLLDVANVYANARNHDFDPLEFMERLPLDRVAYVHVAGGIERHGFYHDTHAHSLPPGVVDLVVDLTADCALPGVMLERDDNFPPASVLHAELDAIGAAAHPSRPLPARQPAPSFPARRRPSSTRRDDLAATQTEVVRALMAHAAVPAGFDPARVQAASAALAAKRARWGFALPSTGTGHQGRVESAPPVGCS